MSTEANVSTVKQRVAHLLHQLPDDCTLEDVQYHLYILQKLQERVHQADEAIEWISQDDAERRMEKWLIK